METKKQFKYFTIAEYEKEQDYLRMMHKSGWKIVKITGFGVYHFEKCTPEDVIYQLDYNKDGLRNKEEYVKLLGISTGLCWIQLFSQASVRSKQRGRNFL